MPSWSLVNEEGFYCYSSFCFPYSRQPSLLIVFLEITTQTRVRGYLSVLLIFHSWRLKLLIYSHVLAIISWELLAPPPHFLENYLLNPFAHSLLELFVVLMVNLPGSLGILDSNPIVYECCPYFLLCCMLSFHSGNYFVCCIDTFEWNTILSIPLLLVF